MFFFNLLTIIGVNYDMTDINAIWEETLKILFEEAASTVAYNTWFKPLVPVDYNNNTFILAAEVDFLLNVVNGRYNLLICNALEQVLSEPVTVKGILTSQINEYENENFQTASKQSLHTMPLNSNAIGINPKYTFDNFVVGAGNRFAHAASLAVAETPAQAYNPLFLYGCSGLGKTHLMHAIGNYTALINPSLKIMYVSSEVFTTELINSIKDNTTEHFKNKYRMIDVLLIDDIQFIGGKKQTEEEFFHTFEHLYQADKQIIISSDRHPKEMNTLEERLTSRFEWGLICDIQAPDYETRLAILHKKMQTLDVTVPNDVLDYIANNVISNIRELEGALTRITAFAKLNNTQLSMSVAENVLKEYSAQIAKTYTVDQIKKYVTAYFDLAPDALDSKKRNKEIAYPRQLAMYICRTLLDYSFPRIGQEFGGRDHTTAIHAINKIENDLATDAMVKTHYNDIIKSIREE